MLLTLYILFTFNIDLGLNNKIDTKCANLKCEVNSEPVCGIKTEGEGFRLRQFRNECDFLRLQCSNQSKDDSVYEIISMDYCLQAFRTDSQASKLIVERKPCIEQDCSNITDTKETCSIRNDGDGFRVRLFQNKCQLRKYNCENGVNFTITDIHICNGMKLPGNTVAAEEVTPNDEDASSELSSFVDVDNMVTENNHTNNDYDDVQNETKTGDTSEEVDLIHESNNEEANDGQNKKADKTNNLIVVRSSLIDFSRINESIRHFFAATHVLDLPVKEVDRTFLNDSTRRKLIKMAGPVKVFVPWVTIPKNISDDIDHRPTLSTCYHKCPRKCPSTYAPVCGVPGIVAREPSLMFQNHCFMDVAQCKMYWENKSPTALSSSYVESSFLFCLGDEMNGMYRFLPLIRTLQHMGRLRKKGHFHYRFKNMKFFNNLLARQPKFMG